MRARTASSILAFAFFLALVPAARGQAAPSAGTSLGVRLDPTPEFRDASRLSEPMDADAFIDLAVRASLVEAADGSFPIETDNAAGRIRSFVDSSAIALREIGSPYERGAAALALLHRQRLRQYRLEQTRIDLAMDSGVYNCVSSALLYMALAKAAGLETRGIETKDHAFATVNTEKGWIDVETTNPYGFDPGTRKETFTDSFGRVTGYAYVPPEQYSRRSIAGDKAMIGLILHNRVSVLEEEGMFRESFCLAVDRYALEGQAAMGEFLLLRAANLASRLIADRDEETALAFLDAYQAVYSGGEMVAQAREVAIRNRLAALAVSGKYDEGYAFIERARRAWGEQPVFAEFDSAAVKNRDIDLMKSGAYQQALDFLDSSAAAGRGAKEDYPALRENAALGLVNASMRAGNYAETLSLIDGLWKKGYLGAAKRGDSLKSAAGNEANRRARADPESGWLSAKDAFDAALAYAAGDPDLLKNRQACLDNYATSVYNRFAAAYNGGKLSDALGILKDGLARYPDSPLLKKRLAELQAAVD
jgi:hypothetical protein